MSETIIASGLHACNRNSQHRPERTAMKKTFEEWKRELIAIMRQHDWADDAIEGSCWKSWEERYEDGMEPGEALAEEYSYGGD